MGLPRATRPDQALFLTTCQAAAASTIAAGEGTTGSALIDPAAMVVAEIAARAVSVNPMIAMIGEWVVHLHQPWRRAVTAIRTMSPSNLDDRCANWARTAATESH